MSDHTKDADALLEKLIYCDLRTSVGIDKAKKNIRMALLQQDKKTRHAVAEEVLRSVHIHRDLGDDMPLLDVIHERIMNCRGGLK